MQIRFSIIFIHRNNLHNIQNAVDSVISSMKANDEIIIVDNNSSDDSMIKLKKPKGVKIISNQCNSGFGYAANQGMSIARGKYYLICNNDIKLFENTLDLFEKYLEKDNSSGLIGPQMISPNGDYMNSYGYRNPSFFSQLDLIGRPIKNKAVKNFSQVGILRGACLAVNRGMVNDLGAYDEDFFFYHEETEWCVRINRSKKWKVMFAPEIKITHIGGASTEKVFIKSRIEFFRSRLLFWKKIFPKYQVIFLYIFNFTKLLFDFSFYLLLTIFTLGLLKKFKRKMLDRIAVIGWLILGQPESWGLPNKCNKVSSS